MLYSILYSNNVNTVTVTDRLFNEFCYSVFHLQKRGWKCIRCLESFFRFLHFRDGCVTEWLVITHYISQNYKWRKAKFAGKIEDEPLSNPSSSSNGNFQFVLPHLYVIIFSNKAHNLILIHAAWYKGNDIQHLIF